MPLHVVILKRLVTWEAEMLFPKRNATKSGIYNDAPILDAAFIYTLHTVNRLLARLFYFDAAMSSQATIPHHAEKEVAGMCQGQPQSKRCCRRHAVTASEIPTFDYHLLMPSLLAVAARDSRERRYRPPPHEQHHHRHHHDQNGI